MKLYVVVEATSGEDSYNYIPYPDVLGIFENYKDAQKCMSDRVEELIDSEEEDVIDINDDGPDLKTITHLEEDWCTTIKIIESDFTTANI